MCSFTTTWDSAVRRPGICGTAIISLWPPVCTSTISRRRAVRRRLGGSPSSTSRLEEIAMTKSSVCGLGAIGLAMVLATPAAAQISTRTDNTAYGGTSGEFLLLDAGARGAPLAGAYAALATDVTALYYNPARLAQLARPSPMVSTYRCVGQTRCAWVGLPLPRAACPPAIGPSRGTLRS